MVSNWVPKKDIIIEIDYNEFNISEIMEIKLENGFTVLFSFSAEIDIIHDIRFYDDEPQSTTKILNPTIQILEVWDESDELVSLENSQEKELIKNILNSIQYG